MKLRILFSVYLCSIFSIMADEFLYPVGIIEHDGQEKLCVLYQKKDHLELWFWNTETGVAVKGLLSSFNPAGVSILPSKKAFSFVDNDRIRVKDLNKRSPKSIDLYGAYDITKIYWINNDSFYFGAQKRGKHHIFYATTDEELQQLTTERGGMYPCYIGSTLFYIEDDSQGNHAIVSVELSLETFQISQETKKAIYQICKNRKTLITFPSKTIAFLSMTNESEGFILEHPNQLSKNETLIPFQYQRIYVDEKQVWHNEVLFSFSLPLSMLLGYQHTTRLYESIFPLLPRTLGTKIYFSNISSDDIVDLFSYDLKTKSIRQETNDIDHHINFAPCIYKNLIYYGGKISSQIRIWMGEDHIPYFSFPSLSK